MILRGMAKMQEMLKRERSKIKIVTISERSKNNVLTNQKDQRSKLQRIREIKDQSLKESVVLKRNASGSGNRVRREFQGSLCNESALRAGACEWRYS